MFVRNIGIYFFHAYFILVFRKRFDMEFLECARILCFEIGFDISLTI